MTYKPEQIMLENEKAFCIDGLDGNWYIYQVGPSYSERRATIAKSFCTLEQVKEKGFIPQWGKPDIKDLTIGLDPDKLPS